VAWPTCPTCNNELSTEEELPVSCGVKNYAVSHLVDALGFKTKLGKFSA
jgi:hypothetical protein